MRDLTTHELDAQLAEQLPARELMGGTCCHSGNTNNESFNPFSIGSGNNGSYNGIANGNEVVVNL